MLFIEPILRHYFDKTKFVQRDRRNPDTRPVLADTIDDFGEDADAIQMVIDNPVFWSTARVIHEIGFQAEFLGRWSEGCPCHEEHRLAYHTTPKGERYKLPKPPTCELQCCRAPELAAGDGLRLFRRILWVSQQNVLSHLAGLPLSEQTSLRHDWDHARSKIEVELTLKLAHWGQLPHLLCALAHPHPSQVMKAAKTALKMFDERSPGSEHQQCKRFLDPVWRGASSDDREEPLRPFVAQTQTQTTGLVGSFILVKKQEYKNKGRTPEGEIPGDRERDRERESERQREKKERERERERERVNRAREIVRCRIMGVYV